MPSATELDIAAILMHSLRQDQPAPTTQVAQLENPHQSTGSTLVPNMGGNGGSECCGGIVDCDNLIE